MFFPSREANISTAEEQGSVSGAWQAEGMSGLPLYSGLGCGHCCLVQNMRVFPRSRCHHVINGNAAKYVPVATKVAGVSEGVWVKGGRSAGVLVASGSESRVTGPHSGMTSFC